jgi:Uma2 family endonuclease
VPRHATLPAMNVQRRPTMTLEQFLDWEERQEARYEFNGFESVLMAGGTEEQAEIQTNILAALRARLRGHKCRVLGSDLKIKVMGRIRYPDAFVVCSPRERGRTVVTDPVIVFEIISESTQHTDLVEKNDEYRETPSIQRYIILEQTHIGGIAFARSEDGRWVSSPLNGPEAVVDLPEIGISLPLGEFYSGMSLAAVDTDSSEPA